MNFNQKVIVPQNVLAQDLDGESALLNIQTQTYYGLDDVGTQMWNALIGHDSIQAAYDVLLAQYAVEPSQLRQDLCQLLERLSRHDLIQLLDI